MTQSLIRREIPRGLPPHRLLGGLPEDCGARVLEACGAEGWGSGPGGSSGGVCLLAAEPEREFRGGLEALSEARSWLLEWGGREPLAALLVGSLAYELGGAFETLPSPREQLPHRWVWLASARSTCTTPGSAAARWSARTPPP